MNSDVSTRDNLPYKIIRKQFCGSSTAYRSNFPPYVFLCPNTLKFSDKMQILAGRAPSVKEYARPTGS